VHLRSISLKGFKSFPDRTRLEFSPGVSVVVGPNGSGKSNITDAVLWALGEQSPLAVRGQSMQDVIFAGAHGVQARSEAEVEVVLDNGDGTVDLPASEVAITRRLDRAGEGEYRVNGARCRLVDVLEILSDTGLGKEMHSVVSQGRVEQIVTSKPRDRRLLIEEAAGLGKHRKRRRRAQLKLARTQDNLDRALDIEREARARLRPLKRQAEAAELHERLERQTDEALWTLAGEDVRAARAELALAVEQVRVAREAYGTIEAELARLRVAREEAERALAARGADREALANRAYAARSAAERIELRLESARAAVAAIADRTQRRRALLAGLEAEAGSDDGEDPGAAERVAGMEAELEQLAQDRHERLARDLEELESRRATAAAELERLAAEADRVGEARRLADAASDAARRARREVDAGVERARREAAKVGADLAAVNQFLRSHVGAPGGAPALADALRAEPGYELALAAALGPRLRAAVAANLFEAGALLDRAGKDGGAALIPAKGGNEGAGSDGRSASAAAGAVRAARGGNAELASSPAPGAEPLLSRVHPEGAGPAASLAQGLLANVWVVERLDGLRPDFRGTAVTRSGRVWSPLTRELLQVPGGGEDRLLAERNRRDELVQAAERAAQAERAVIAEGERASRAVAAADAARDEADRALRTAVRARDEASEAVRHAGWLLDQRKRAPDESPTATRRAQLGAALAAERRLAERAERERRDREGRLALERARLEEDDRLAPAAQRLVEALAVAGKAVGARQAALQAELDADRAAGERLAADLRAGAAAENAAQTRLHGSSEAVTRAEVRAQQARDRAAEVGATLSELATKLGLDAEPAGDPLAERERDALAARIERLQRRREQLGPVNPLAQDEYAEAIAHVEELEARREDLEDALRELKGLIRDTDTRIREAFEETFTAAAKNFEEVAEQLFPGGRGRLRLVREDAGPRPVLGGAEPEESPSDEERLEQIAESEESGDPDDGMGVEIEITPAGKSTKRLTLLSGGEKSLTALAFLFAVFLARPCPFYILDEVEAALDDLNIDRFLGVLRRFSDRAQFIVVTHQKRTMEAADCLYGVSMAGNGVSKVVSRRLPPRVAA
jgi:chromosome segregation protein